MRILGAALLLSLSIVAYADPSCRFAPGYDKGSIASDSKLREQFLEKFISQEAKFIKDIGTDETGLTKSQFSIDVRTGMPNLDSKFIIADQISEAYHISLLAKAINNDDKMC